MVLNKKKFVEKHFFLFDFFIDWKYAKKTKIRLMNIQIMFQELDIYQLLIKKQQQQDQIGFLLNFLF